MVFNMYKFLIWVQRPKKLHIYTITGCAVDRHNDLWERVDCPGLGQLYGMSIWGGGWGVTGPDNVRAQPGKLLES